MSRARRIARFDPGEGGGDEWALTWPFHWKPHPLSCELTGRWQTFRPRPTFVTAG